MDYLQPAYPGSMDPTAFWNLNALSSVCMADNRQQPVMQSNNSHHHFLTNSYQPSLLDTTSSSAALLHQSMTSESDVSSDVTPDFTSNSHSISMTRSDSEEGFSDKSISDKSLGDKSFLSSSGHTPEKSLEEEKQMNVGRKSAGKSTTSQLQRKFGTEKPPYSYMAMIVMAIESSSTGMMSLSDIYAYIEKRFPFYHKHQKRWQNSIRHNLSLNDCFLKVPRGVKESQTTSTKGSYWAMHPNSGNMFKDGSFLRRAKKFKLKKADKSQQKDMMSSKNYYHNLAYESSVYGSSALGNLATLSSNSNSHPYATYMPPRASTTHDATSVQKSSAAAAIAADAMTSHHTLPATNCVTQTAAQAPAFHWTPYPDMYYNAHAHSAHNTSSSAHYSNMAAFKQANNTLGGSDYFSQMNCSYQPTYNPFVYHTPVDTTTMNGLLYNNTGACVLPSERSTTGNSTLSMGQMN